MDEKSQMIEQAQKDFRERARELRSEIVAFNETNGLKANDGAIQCLFAVGSPHAASSGMTVDSSSSDRFRLVLARSLLKGFSAEAKLAAIMSMLGNGGGED